MAKGGTAVAKRETSVDAPLTAFREKRPSAKQVNGEQLLQTLMESGEVTAATELGDGWTILNKDEKQQLVGVPFVVVDWNINEGDNGEFVSLSVVVVKTSQCFIVNDGSTGILRQIKQYYQDDGNTNALYCKRGLRVSEYDYIAPDGSKKPAKTYYIDTSA